MSIDDVSTTSDFNGTYYACVEVHLQVQRVVYHVSSSSGRRPV